ncbi:hypothetical protein TNCV_2327721 [Trichonephila clavipes]|nr:hypothetical protein TNCV_2327721 [Trichonephila clavipes]
MGQFYSDDDVKATVLNWFHDQWTSFFADGIRRVDEEMIPLGRGVSQDDCTIWLGLTQSGVVRDLPPATFLIY